MKRWFCFLIAVLMLLCSCGEPSESHDAFFDTYLLTDMRVGPVSTPAVFNPASGSTTPLCFDPLCDHTAKADCPFAGYNAIWTPHYYDGAIWFQSAEGGKILEADIMRYDMESGKVTVFASQAELRSMIPEHINQDNGQSFGFFESYFRYSVRGADHTPAYQLRISLDDGEIEVLDNNYRQPFAKYKKLSLSYTPERATIGVSYGITLTDEKGNVKETILPDKRISITFDDLLDEGKLIYVTAAKREDNSYDWDHMTVWLYDMETGEDRIIVNNFPYSYIAVEGDYIYYSKYVDNPPKLGYDLNHSEDIFNLSGGILFRTNIHTGEESIAFEMPEYVLIGTEINRVGQYIIIDYRNTDYDTYTEDVSDRGIWYDYAKENGRIVYDTLSGMTAVYKEAVR
ncbi:MAG: hypothetical protein IJA85_10565 [Clostridia bacterium]|nr:hypothetical protein [Clostridia bacterium]